MSQSDFVTRGQALISAGQYQEAVKVCRLGLLGRPTTVEGRVVLGQALLALKRYDEVLAEMRVALELDHGSAAAQLLKGEALLRKGDAAGAIDVLGKLRSLGLGDSRVAELLGEAERLVGRALPTGASQPAFGGRSLAPGAGFTPGHADAFDADQGTKNYPAHADVTRDDDDDGQEDTGGEYTRPTSLAQPSARNRAPAPSGLPPDATPSPAVLAVGDRSGTVEVDPELEGLELRASEDDFGEVVAPPVARRRPDPSARGAVIPSSGSPRSPAVAAAQAKKPRRANMFKEEVSTVELDDDSMIDVAEVTAPSPRAAPRKQGGTAVRNAVKMPSGPIDLPIDPPPPAQLAQRIANQPHIMNVASQASARSAIVAAMPTAAAAPMPMQPASAMGIPPHLQATQMPGMAPMMPPQPMPPQPAIAMAIPPHLQATQMPMPGQLPGMGAPRPMPGVPMMPAPSLQVMPYQPPQAAHQLPAHLQSSLAAARPTIALNHQQQQSAAAVDALFNGRPGSDGAARPAPELDPRIAAMIGGTGSSGVPAAFAGEAGSSPSKPMRTGMRKRSRLQILVWIVIGAAVIGGGVFAGFQIRAIRLRKQIAAARDRAVDLAKADTWQGWIGARDSLLSIAQASATIDNKAALARARGVLALEFGDGVADARAAVDALAGQSGADLELAAAYVALAQSDAKAARELAERAKQASATDAAAMYVAGQAALLAGDGKAAVDELRHAYEREPRPLYAVALARALGAASAWDEALTIVGKAGDNPAAVITRAVLLAGAGRAVGAPASEIRAQLGKLIAEGGKPAADQPRGVSPAQVAFAQLALAQIDFARNDLGAARADYRASLDLQLSDQRFAEELTETVYAIGELETARKAAVLALDKWPTSRRARTTLAQVWLALGQPTTAIDLFTKTPDAAAWPRGQTVRGQARQATGDLDGARADFDAALKKLPGYEPAVVARAWLDLAAGELDDARQRIEPKFNPKTATAAMVAVYAELQRLGGDAAARDKAKALLERFAGGGPSPDTVRIQLALARIDRDLGDVRGAKAAYAEASRTGNVDARLESGQLQIEDSDPAGGRATLEQLVKDAGDHPSAVVLIETARARTLTGDPAGAAELLAAAAKVPGVIKWQLERERARLALYKGDAAGAAQGLVRALDGCGADLDSFLLAADTVSTDDKQAALAQKLSALVPVRLKGRPEADLIAGKLDLAANKLDDAEKAYNAARDGLVAEKASQRRRAQAAFGLGAIGYFKHDDPAARAMLELVIVEDPSIYAAYLFAAEIAKTKRPKDALQRAQEAAKLNPASLDAWKLVGTIAAQLGNRALVRDAITRVGELAPGSETLRELQALR